MNFYKSLYIHWIKKAREMERTSSRLKYLKEFWNHRTFPKLLSRFQQNYSPADAQGVVLATRLRKQFNILVYFAEKAKANKNKYVQKYAHLDVFNMKQSGNRC